MILKRILPQLREREEFVHMFMDEARISALLAHPNIAKVYELTNEGQSLFIAMEFVAGQSLANILRRCHKLGRPVPVGAFRRQVLANRVPAPRTGEKVVPLVPRRVVILDVAAPALASNGACVLLTVVQE